MLALLALILLILWATGSFAFHIAGDVVNVLLVAALVLVVVYLYQLVTKQRSL